MKKYIFACMIGLLFVGGVVFAADIVQYFQGNTTVTIGDRSEDVQVGAFAGPEIYQDLDVHGYVAANEKITTAAGTPTASTTTLLLTDSGTTFIISGTGTAFTLPAVAVSDGVNYKFVTGAADLTTNATITSADGDDIEGTLIVAGAVVDCDASDVLTFVATTENIGDFVEIMSDGTYWYIISSGVLTASMLTCTG